MNNSLLVDICIIGAGASGLVAAIESSRRGLSCVVVDKNKKPGMKLYATGNGRCNLTNDDWEEDTYYENEFVDKVYDSLYKLTGKRQRSFVLDYFKNLGVQNVSKNGYYYPASMQASTVVWALTDTAKNLGVTFRLKTKAEYIERIENYYSINISMKEDDEIFTDKIYARNVVIATGGLSSPKLGAIDSSNVYSLYNSISVPYNTFSSGLTSVKTIEDMSNLSGVRTQARISIKGHTELGELQITDYGFSGIVTFNMSYYMKPGDKITVNLMPKKSENDFAAEFNDIKSRFPERRLDLFLNGYINDKLSSYFIQKFYGNPEMKLCLKDITETGIRGLYQEITEWSVGIKAINDFDQSQASSGGIVVSILDPYSMEIDSDKTLGPGIYAVGEATDVLGKCGGYNLTYAFITGYLAGISVE